MPPSAPSITSRRVVIVAFPDVQCLDVTGPHEVFAMANRTARAPRYTVELVAPAGGVVRASSGLGLVADQSFAACDGPIDTLVVAGGLGTRTAVDDPDLIAWLRGAAGRSRRVTSVCTGALVLAAAGLLDGRRVTSHWSACETLAERHPTVTVELFSCRR